MELKQGPYDGWWVMDGDKILIWCYTKELAEKRLVEMSSK